MYSTYHTSPSHGGFFQARGGFDYDDGVKNLVGDMGHMSFNNDRIQQSPQNKGERSRKKKGKNRHNNNRGKHGRNRPPQNYTEYDNPYNYGAGFVPGDGGMNQYTAFYPQQQQQHGFFDPQMQYFGVAEYDYGVVDINDVVNRVYSLARTQHGAKQLQKFLESDTSTFAVIFPEIQSNFRALVTDPFGHHVCLKCLEFIEKPQVREELLRSLQNDFIDIILGVHGTRVVQKLLELMSSPEELRIVQTQLMTYVVQLAKDVYGMHVVLRCLHRIPPPDLQNPDEPNNKFIFDEITKNIVSVATHKHGCCVVQWCIDYATQQQRKMLVSVIVMHSLELSQDAFGNYVVQQIMDPTHPEVLRELVTHLNRSITKLAVQKFSSIVIEKCLEYTEADQQMLIINELVQPHKISRLLQDPYANYVIQKALSVTRQENFQRVVSLIRPHLGSLSNTPFGKRIKTQMVRRFPILSMSEGGHAWAQNLPEEQVAGRMESSV